jgi:hypothetical protein
MYWSHGPTASVHTVETHTHTSSLKFNLVPRSHTFSQHCRDSCTHTTWLNYFCSHSPKALVREVEPHVHTPSSSNLNWSHGPTATVIKGKTHEHSPSPSIYYRSQVRTALVNEEKTHVHTPIIVGPTALFIEIDPCTQPPLSNLN